MLRHVALYRGINVGGHNPVRMESLRAMHERLGHRAVASYLQSGNIVFSAKGPLETTARKIEAGFLDEFGFAARVVVVPVERWSDLVRDNPFQKFSAIDPKTVHAALCRGEPSTKGLQSLLDKAGGSESFVTAGSAIYLHTPDGFGTSKFAAGIEKACGVPTTMRNWRTVDALLKLLDGDAGSSPHAQ